MFVTVSDAASPKKETKEKDVTAEAVAAAEAAEEVEYERAAQGSTKIFSTSKPKVTFPFSLSSGLLLYSYHPCNPSFE